jgi:hypothetical protein
VFFFTFSSKIFSENAKQKSFYIKCLFLNLESDLFTSSMLNLQLHTKPYNPNYQCKTNRYGYELGAMTNKLA